MEVAGLSVALERLYQRLRIRMAIPRKRDFFTQEVVGKLAMIWQVVLASSRAMST